MTLFLFAWLAMANLLPPSAPIPQVTTVTVVVTKLPSATATLKLYFYNVKANFLVRNQYTLLKHLKPGGSNQLVYPIQLPPGEWAIAATQDLNENDLVDKNVLGIPSEPFALSNVGHPRFKVPSFEDCKFNVDGPTTVTIAMK